MAGTRFTYPGGIEGWVDLGNLIAARSEIEPTTAWSQVRRPNRYAKESPRWMLIPCISYTYMHSAHELSHAISADVILVCLLTYTHASIVVSTSARGYVFTTICLLLGLIGLFVSSRLLINKCQSNLAIGGIAANCGFRSTNLRAKTGTPV